MIADFVTARLIRSTGLNLQRAYNRSLKSLGLFRLLENSGNYKHMFGNGIYTIVVGFQFPIFSFFPYKLLLIFFAEIVSSGDIAIFFSFSPYKLLLFFFVEIVSSGDIAALVYLWNPFTIISCVGLSTSPIENLVVMMCLYGACTRKKFLFFA